MKMLKWFWMTAAVAALVVVGSGCERHSWEVTSTLRHHDDHGEHAEHDHGDHEKGHDDHDKGHDPGGKDHDDSAHEPDKHPEGQKKDDPEGEGGKKLF